MEPMTCEASCASVGLRPAPEVPEAATMVMPSAEITPWLNSGASASATEVG